MIQICENGHNRIAYDDNDITEHDGCPYCSMYKDMSQYLQEAKKFKPLTPAEAEALIRDFEQAACSLIDTRDFVDRKYFKTYYRRSKAALIAALTGGTE